MRNILVGALLLMVGACETIGFYGQAVSGQLAILRAKQPSEAADCIADDGRCAARATAAGGVVAEVSPGRTSRLDPKRRYSSYARIDRKYVVWNVFATPEFSTDPIRWCYPIAGCATYRGYFSQSGAERYARQLGVQRRDTVVGGVVAYSTLGWFDDPVLSTFVNWPDADLAGLIFHELAHGRVFVPGDTPFNEAFASFVERRGVMEWLRATHDQARIDATLARWKRSDRFIAYLLQWRDELQTALRPTLQRVCPTSAEDGAAERGRTLLPRQRGTVRRPGLVLRLRKAQQRTLRAACGLQRTARFVRSAVRASRRIVATVLYESGRTGSV